MVVKLILFTFFSFLLGSILFSKHITMIFKNVNISEISDDKNPGTYNAYKHGGFWVGLFSLVLDVLKGFIPLFIAVKMFDVFDFSFVFIMMAPVMGHIIGVFDNFKGGKGIAVSIGVLLGIVQITYIPLLILLGLYIITSIINIKPNNFRSILTYFLFAATCLILGIIKSHIIIAIGCLFISIPIIIKHLNLEKLYSYLKQEK